MRRIAWLSAQDPPDAFPAVEHALAEPNGLLAAGGDLRSERLLAAYRRGIFPWYEAGQPILWWSPDPRAVLWPEALHVSRSLRKKLERETFTVTADREFAAVLDACAAPRKYAPGTWLTSDMRSAYTHLHELGWAHSFEAWQHGALVGGLYGVYLGRAFFGESMFARITDASKVCFVHAVNYLKQRGCALIDCQIQSSHLQRLGATTIPRQEFLRLLSALCERSDPPAAWSTDFATTLRAEDTAGKR
jgi:leucyl/phenylalanyl-tRNA--protein transferase